MRNTLHRPNLETYRQYTTEVVPEMRRRLRIVTADAERDDSSFGDKDEKLPRTQLEALGHRYFGAIVLKETTAPIDIFRADGSPALRQHEPFVGFHLRYLDPEETSQQYVNESLSDVARHLLDHEKRTGDVIAGITYARLGKVANVGFGFESTELPGMPEYTNPDIQPVLVHAGIDDFIERYAAEY